MKRFSTIHRFLIPLGLALASPSARAAGDAQAVPTLEALVAEISAKNPEVRFYEAELDAAKAGRRSAGAWRDPEVGVQGGRKRVRDATGVLSGEGNAWSVSVTQTFEWPGRLALRKSIANREIALAELGLARFKAALKGRARSLGYGLQAAQDKSAAAQEVAERYQVLRELFLAREPAGLTPLLETRVIEAQEIALKRRATASQLTALAALVELNQLRGAAFDAPISAGKAELVFHAAPPLDELLAAGREKNFEFLMTKVELEKQGFAVSLARHERYPAVSVSPFASRDKAGDIETIVGLGVSVPLPLTSRSRGAVEVAEARRRQAETTVLVAQRDLERDVITTAQAFAVKLAATTQWKSDSVGKFREAAALADRHYRLGAVPLSTYVELQHAYLDAVEALLDTQREALDAGQRLELLTGLPFNAVETKP